MTETTSTSSCCRTCGDGLPGNNEVEPLEWFGGMVGHCYAYATAAVEAGRPVVGIMCEYTPRELIMAAGGVPVCLCGGDADQIPEAETELPSNLCPLIKSTYGYHLRKANPFLEMASLLVAETTCDGKKKMFELMSRSRSIYVLELPQKENDPDALAQWIRELRKFRSFLEQQFDCSITDEALRDAIRTMNRERALRRRLAETMAADQPRLTGRQLLDFKSLISCIPADLEQYERALTLYGNGETPDKASAPRARVLLTGVPVPHGAEHVVDLIEERGGHIVCMENCTGVKPILDDVDEEAEDPIAALAEKYYHLPCSVMTRNDGRLDLLRELAEKYRPDCIIDLVWQACLTYDVEAARVREMAEKDLKLPYLKIVTDYSTSDAGRIATRIEALFEMTR